MNSDRVRTLVQYILATGGREDPGHRELGLIHLVKYIYLADLAFAEEHNGETFTEVDWRFHHFGPWAEDVAEQIESVADVAGARRQVVRNQDGNGATHWSLDDEALRERLESQLPREVSEAIRRAVREYGNRTSKLLHHVYLTPPMLRAAPGEVLDFRTCAKPAEVSGGVQGEPTPCVRLSTRAKSQREQALQDLRRQVKERIAARRERRKVVLAPAPRYDEVFFKGLAWLDELAGEPITAQTGELIVSDAVWKAPSRREPGVP